MSLLQRAFYRIAMAWNKALNRLRLPAPISHDFHSTTALSSTLNSVPDLMFELDIQGRYWDFRVMRTDLLVAPPSKLLGNTVSDVMSEEAAKLILDALKKSAKYGQSHGTHILLPTAIGERWFELSIANKKDTTDEGLRFIVLSRDITERKLSQLENERLAFIDPLTGLPNRRWQEAQLKALLENCRQNQQYGALLFLDLDNFKQLNDRKGHQLGDMMLKIVAQRLRSTIRKDDLVSRWGGDEFIIMIRNLGSDSQRALKTTNIICAQLLKRISCPYDVEGQKYHCQASIGAKLFDGQDMNSEKIISQADTAMYFAKRTQRGKHVIFTSHESLPTLEKRA